MNHSSSSGAGITNFIHANKKVSAFIGIDMISAQNHLSHYKSNSRLLKQTPFLQILCEILRNRRDLLSNVLYNSAPYVTNCLFITFKVA
jgi:hypothetical protein